MEAIEFILSFKRKMLIGGEKSKSLEGHTCSCQLHDLEEITLRQEFSSGLDLSLSILFELSSVFFFFLIGNFKS